MPIISVIVPVYNAKKYLERCVKSIINQRFSDFELILIDDGSIDGSSQLCDDIAANDYRIKVYHTANCGVASARNLGLDVSNLSNSEWISYIDGDDWVSPYYLEKLYKLAKDNGVLCSICGVKYTDGVDTITTGKVIGKIHTDDFFALRNNVGDNTCVVSVHDKLYNKKLFDNLRFPVGHIHEDRALSYKLLVQCDFVAVTNEQLYFYFNAPNSIARSPWSTKRMSDICFLDEQYYYFLNNKGYVNAFYSTVMDYFIDCSMFLFEIKRSHFDEYKKFYKIIYKKMKIMYHKHKEILLKDNELYETVCFLLHPFFSKLKKYYKKMLK